MKTATPQQKHQQQRQRQCKRKQLLLSANKENAATLFASNSDKCASSSSSSSSGSSLNVSRVKRLRLSSLSPNTSAQCCSSSSHSAYSSMLAKAAAATAAAGSLTPQQQLLFKARPLLHLNENSSCSRDSGIVSSPASSEIQLLLGSMTSSASSQQRNQEPRSARPRLLKHNYLDVDIDEDEDFSSSSSASSQSSSSSSSSSSSVSAEVDDEEDYSRLFEHTIALLDDEETQDSFAIANTTVSSSVNTTQARRNASLNSSLGGGQARRCLFKESPAGSPSLVSNLTPLAPAESTSSAPVKGRRCCLCSIYISSIH